MRSAPAARTGVVVAHPGRQYSYEAALAAREHGMLRAFATGFYIRSPLLARALATGGGFSGPLGSAADRFHPSLDPSLVETFPRGHIRARLLRRFRRDGSLQRRAERLTDEAIARWLPSLEPGPAVVHVWEGGGLETLRAARAIGAATVLDVAGAHERVLEVLQDEGVPLRNPDTALIVSERELADVLLAPSAFVAECLIEHGVPEGRIVRMPFGVDAERFAPAVERDDGVFRALFAGSAGVRKGLRYLLEAWDDLALPGSELVVAGATDAGGRGNRRGNVRLLGQVARYQMTQLYASSDLFVFPSLAEGSALVTYEAMAAGLPVVTTPNAGSVVEDGVHGFLVPPRDVATTRDRIRELYDDAERRREMGRAARALVLSRYTWAHYRRRLAALYTALASGEGVADALSGLEEDRSESTR